jgi:soluble lytic murein transglycosylase
VHKIARKAVLIAGVAAMASVAARAQSQDTPAGGDPLGDLLSSVLKPAAMGDAPMQPSNASHRLSDRDAGLLRQAIEAARRVNVTGARDAIGQMSDPLAQKAATWVLVDACADSVGFYEVDKARVELAAWPRAGRRQAAAERLIETSGKSAQQIVDWFAGAEPTTAQGALALATAEKTLGRTADATALVKHWWRDRSFDEATQSTMLNRFSDALTQDDHIHRADVLLYGKEGGAARQMIAMLPADQQAMAKARLALRAETRDANELFNALTPEQQASPGVAFERAAYQRRKGLDMLALAQVANFPHEATSPDQAERIWEERRHLVLSALRAGDNRAAYAAAADSGLSSGSPGADAEFDAGWIALTKLNEPAKAAKHFAALEKIGAMPITRGRAFYWEGRAAEAKGDHAAAQGFYGQAARYDTTFYGMLAAEKLGQRLTLVSDPIITPQTRSAFEARDEVAAARLFYDYGYRDLFQAFVLGLDDVLPNAADEAQLVDMAREYGGMQLSMRAARTAAQRGFVLPQRAYPMHAAPDGGAAEPALVLAITRQESNFDPSLRSGVGARGMMQLMPSTAKILARRIGVSYSPSQLDEPDYNMRLGSHYLGSLVSQFSGSYIMAAAGYNAGPGRPSQWVQICGDPRGGSTDPVDFIECIPFSETRNYVMRVMENMEVYRAKLNGGSVQITLSEDLKRGAYGTAIPSLPLTETSTTTGH